MKIIFKEKQRFKQWWLRLILIGIGALPIFGIYRQLTVEDKSMPDLGLIIYTILVFGLIAMFVLMRLKTEINENEIRISLFPFVRKKVTWGEIKSAQIVIDGFVGGWGIQLSTKYGTTYNICGNKGLAIELKNGKKILIGTQKETELKNIVENVSW